MLSKDLKEKVAVSLLRRHSENDYFRNRLKRVKRELTFSETNQISMLLFLRMIVLNDCLLRWIAARLAITAMSCCEGLLRKTVWCNRSFKVSVGTKVSFRDLALKRYK